MSVSKCETCKYMQKVQNSNAQLCTKNAKIVINNGILNNPCSRYEAIEENKEEDSTKETTSTLSLPSTKSGYTFIPNTVKEEKEPDVISEPEPQKQEEVKVMPKRTIGSNIDRLDVIKSFVYDLNGMSAFLMGTVIQDFYRFIDSKSDSDFDRIFEDLNTLKQEIKK